MAARSEDGGPRPGPGPGLPGDPRRSPLLLNPLTVLDLVLRNVVPGYPANGPSWNGHHWSGHAGNGRSGNGGSWGGGSWGGTADGVARRMAGAEAAAPRYTRAEAAGRAGLDEEDMGRLWRALGFAELADDAPGYSEADVDAVREVAELADEGVVGIDQVIGMVRPMGHLVSRLGAAQVSALSGLAAPVPDGDGDPAGPAGLTPPGSGSPPVTGTCPVGGAPSRRALAVARPGAERLVPLLERLVVHAWRRHLMVAASAAVPIRRLDTAVEPRAVGFIDITSYTALSRRIDWSELSALLDRFEACVFDRVADSGGRVVKTLGDEVLFVASDPAAGAEIALAVVDATRADLLLPPVHAGLAYGPLLERAGDVFGPTVNVASRLTGLAHAGTVLVDAAFQHELDADPRFRTQRRPRRPVRGYTSLSTYRLRRADVRTPRPARTASEPA